MTTTSPFSSHEPERQGYTTTTKSSTVNSYSSKALPPTPPPKSRHINMSPRNNYNENSINTREITPNNAAFMKK